MTKICHENTKNTKEAKPIAARFRLTARSLCPTSGSPSARWRKPGSQSCNQAGDCDAVFSFPMFRDLEKVQTAFTGIAAHRTFGANLSFAKQTINGQGMLVSGSYFPVL